MTRFFVTYLSENVMKEAIVWAPSAEDVRNYITVMSSIHGKNLRILDVKQDDTEGYINAV